MCQKIIVICGPTASGKSEAAIRLALAIKGEILSADSMQAYRRLDIGTAKPSRSEQEQVRHHLLDFLDMNEALNVHRYLEIAKKTIEEIGGRGAVPIVAGGSGMYLKAIIFGLDPLPGDEALRLELERQFAGEDGFRRLQETMKIESPRAYEKWSYNHRKLLRAHEIILLEGKSPTGESRSWQKKPKDSLLAFYLKWDRDELKRRIALRCDKMLESGWIEETESLMKNGFFETPTARQALGYRIVGDFIEGKIGREEMRSRIATATWQYARRQETWFKKENYLRRIEMPKDEDLILRISQSPEEAFPNHPDCAQS